MKTPKEKAEELVEKYYNSEQLCDCQTKYIVRRSAIECGKIAVYEIIEAGNDIISELIDGFHDLEFNMYWQEVKNELNKM